MLSKNVCNLSNEPKKWSVSISGGFEHEQFVFGSNWLDFKPNHTRTAHFCAEHLELEYISLNSLN